MLFVELKDVYFCRRSKCKESYKSLEYGDKYTTAAEDGKYSVCEQKSKF